MPCQPCLRDLSKKKKKRHGNALLQVLINPEYSGHRPTSYSRALGLLKREIEIWIAYPACLLMIHRAGLTHAFVSGEGGLFADMEADLDCFNAALTLF